MFYKILPYFRRKGKAIGARVKFSTKNSIMYYIYIYIYIYIIYYILYMYIYMLDRYMIIYSL